MLYPCKLNIYLNFQRLSGKFGERWANGNPGIFAYNSRRFSAYTLRSLRFNGPFNAENAEIRREMREIVKTC